MNNFPSKEYELISRIKAILPPVSPHSPYELAIGDDAAIRVNRTEGERLIVTADVSVENVHFSLETMNFEEIGYRSMASNLSDCAAMGAKPDGAVVQLVFPKTGGNDICIDDINPVYLHAATGEHSSPLQPALIRPQHGAAHINPVNNISVNTAIERIYAGFSKACGRWNFPVVGGDLSGGGAWTIGITLIGSAPPGGRLLTRTGVMDGDALWVTGIPGESAAGLAALAKWGRGGVPAPYERFVKAHVAPEPAVGEGAALAANPSAHAMMDLSDGLSKDVATLCFDNDLGFVFDTEAVKSVPPVMIDLADALGADYKDWFYHGGEEYELLFACEPEFDPFSINIRVNNNIDRIDKNKPNMMRLGRFTSKRRGVWIPAGDGDMEELRAQGWDHITLTTPLPAAKIRANCVRPR